MNVLVPILVAIFNAVGPGIIDLIKQAFSHPTINDNCKAAVAALMPQVKQDIQDVHDAAKPLPVPTDPPRPTLAGGIGDAPIGSSKVGG